MHRVIQAQPQPDLTIQIKFEDGLVKLFDMRPFIGEGISAPLADWNFFQQVTLEEGGGITWPNGYDFCPEFLYADVPVLKPA